MSFLSEKQLRDLDAVITQYSGQGVVEVEARLGVFKKVTNMRAGSAPQRFDSTVDRARFTTFRSYLRTIASERTTSQKDETYRGGFRKTGNKWIRKNKLIVEDLPEFGVRFAVSSEEEVHNPKVEGRPYERTKNRYSYEIPEYGCRVDLTDVVGGTGPQQRSVYEVEFEMLPHATLDTFVEGVYNLLGLFQKSDFPMEIAFRDEVINDFNRLVMGRPGFRLDHTALVQSRNLKIRDLVEGGIVQAPRGGPATYTVTQKADGERACLFLRRGQAFFIHPPFVVNWIGEYSIQSDSPNHDGTILDGELIPVENRLSGAPEDDYWYLIFDCICFDGESIVEYGHMRRMGYAQTISNEVHVQRMTMNTKTFIGVELDFFDKVSTALDAKVPYVTDGLIFTPDDSSYNPHNEELNHSKRVLTNVPDICKWKPPHQLTIDFLVRWTSDAGRSKARLFSSNDRVKVEGVRLGGFREDGQIKVDTDLRAIQAVKGQRLSSVKDLGKTEVILELRNGNVYAKGEGLLPFTGDRRKSYNGSPKVTMVQVPSNTVAEFAWDFDEEEFVFVRQRQDKANPNRISVAMDIWEDIHEPITEEMIRGREMILMRKYHNVLKRELFEQDDGKTLLDIGSGKGGDISKWRRYDRVVAVEPDEENLQELRRRLENSPMKDKVFPILAKGEDHKRITEAVKHFIGGPVDTVSMMLSLSFFFGDPEMLKSLTKTIGNNLKVGGRFLFMSIEGKATLRALAGKNELDFGFGYLKLEGNDRVKVHFNDSIVQHQTEWLVDTDKLERELAVYGVSDAAYTRADGTLLSLNYYAPIMSRNERLLSSMYVTCSMTRLSESGELPKKEIIAVGPDVETRPNSLLVSPQSSRPYVQLPETYAEILQPGEKETINLQGQIYIRIGTEGDPVNAILRATDGKAPKEKWNGDLKSLPTLMKIGVEIVTPQSQSMMYGPRYKRRVKLLQVRGNHFEILGVEDVTKSYLVTVFEK